MAKGYSSKKIGPYNGMGGIGEKTKDSSRKKMGELAGNGSQKDRVYDDHKKKVASKDAEILKSNPVPEYRQQ